MNLIHLIAVVGLTVLAVSMYIYNRSLDIDKDFKPEVKRRYTWS